jgi:hypothetical protein
MTKDETDIRNRYVAETQTDKRQTDLSNRPIIYAKLNNSTLNNSYECIRKCIINGVKA